MKQKIYLFFSLFCTLCAFFLGYIFAYMQDFTRYEKEKERQKFVIIDTKKTAINFSTPEESIIFILNGEPTTQMEIKLKENE